MFCTTDWIWTAANWLFLLGVGVFVFCPFDISLIFFLWYISFSFFGQSGTFLREVNFMFWAVWGILNINLIPLEDKAEGTGSLSLPLSLPGAALYEQQALSAVAAIRDPNLLLTSSGGTWSQPAKLLGIRGSSSTLLWQSPTSSPGFMCYLLA